MQSLNDLVDQVGWYKPIKLARCCGHDEQLRGRGGHRKVPDWKAGQAKSNHSNLAITNDTDDGFEPYMRR